MAKQFFKVEGLAGVLKTLRELPPEVVSKNGGPVRRALRKASVVIRDQAKANVQRIIDAPNIDGLPTKSTGLLVKSIGVKRRAPKGFKGEVFVVNIARRRYPESRGRNTTAAQVGRLLESGSERRQAYPWMRPAFEAKKEEAVRVFTSDLTGNLKRIVKKLAKANAGAK